MSVVSYAAIGLSLALDAMAFGAWYTASRAFVRDVFGSEAYTFVALLIATESLPFLFSPLAGLIGDVYGRRLVALTGVLRAPLVALVAFVDPRLIPLLVLFTSALSIVFYTNALGLLLGSIAGSGRLYGLITLLTPISYGLGSILPGLLEPVGGYKLVFATIGFIDGIGPLVLMLASEPPRASGFDFSSLTWLLRVIPFRLIAAMILGNIALTLFWNLMGIKLYEVTGSLLAFGLVGGFLTTILSMIARPVAGILVDVVKADVMLALSYAAYLVYNTILYHAGGLLFILLWLIPLYPFREVAQTMSLSRRIPMEHQAKVAGLLNTLWGLGSLAYLVAYISGIGLEQAFTIQLITLALSTLMLVWLIVDPD